MNTVKADFSSITGKIKPLHAMCCAPYTPMLGDDQKHIDKYFREGKIPYCRLHDCCGSWGGTHFVDVPNIFPDFSLDETDPESYDFHYSDEYISAIVKSGCRVYYRLGVTIEWGSKKYATLPPADFAKWARICEHIIMHYNEGWADGFNFNIEYWEIWNEPENPGNDFGPSQWGGTKEEFFKLYEIASGHLKARFPDIKIGGYGSCGFYTLTRDNNPPEFAAFVPYFTDFLAMLKERGCPLDFYSWHIYTGDETELLTHARFVRETLDEYGFKNTEAHLNEWNIHSEGHGFAAKHTEEGASFNAAVMAMLQYADYVDMAMYYCFSYTGAYNGLLNQNDKSTDVTWYPFAAFGRLYELQNAVRVAAAGEHIYAAGATDGSSSGLLISNYRSDEEKCGIFLSGIGDNKEIKVYAISGDKRFEQIFSFTASAESKITLSVPQRTVIYLEIV